MDLAKILVQFVAAILTVGFTVLAAQGNIVAFVIFGTLAAVFLVLLLNL